MSITYYLQTMSPCHRVVTWQLVVRILMPSSCKYLDFANDGLYHSVVKAHSQETPNLSTFIPLGFNLPFRGQIAC